MQPCPYYRLAADGRTPVAEPDPLVWAQWFETADRVLARTVLPGGVVSTVFLGLDHQWRDGPPVLWETLVFMNGGAVSGSMQRYTSAAAALIGHDIAVARGRLRVVSGKS